MHADPRSAEQLYGVKPARYCSRCHYRNLRCLLQKVKATRKPDTFRRSLDGDLSSRILLFRVFHAFRFPPFSALSFVSPRESNEGDDAFSEWLCFSILAKELEPWNIRTFWIALDANENEDNSVLCVRFRKRICVSSFYVTLLIIGFFFFFLNIDKIDLGVQQ